MGRGNYSKEPDNPAKSAKARGTNLRVHYKNTRETTMALRGKTLQEGMRYLEQVLEHKAAIPFRRHTGGIGRHPQAKMYNHINCRWPKKSCEVVLGLLKNLESNAEGRGLDVSAMKLTHLQVQQAPKQRRRTYRAHGRINPYMASPCHIEIIATEHEDNVPGASTAVDTTD
eukprot:CAMPEP_0119155598 /NCGR_PEP_ID=MMETSP1310-20130426/51827_1 /TAXON_ID=464262 /ORGANISM="Genus nov. species nov., Strain RCC2339" /LENGTH=170 /DNA_ID=CAMNT_0007148197 /DNA_START=74 /DNA_END=586 /DNA_ORIENTATION=+